MSSKSTILLEHHLKELKLPSFLREYGKMAARCAAEGVDHPQYLLRLAELELIDRHQPMVERRIRAARFPTVKSLDTFDFPAIPSVNKATVIELARREYIQHRENVIAVGNSGTGKTHVALGLGLAACQRGMSVGFTTAAVMVSRAGPLQERDNWEPFGEGRHVHWPDLDEDISIEGLLAGRKSGESIQSFARWLEAKEAGFPLNIHEIRPSGTD